MVENQNKKKQRPYYAFGCTKTQCKNFETKQERTLKHHVLTKHANEQPVDLIVLEELISIGKKRKRKYQKDQTFSSEDLFKPARKYAKDDKKREATGDNKGFKLHNEPQPEEDKDTKPPDYHQPQDNDKMTKRGNVQRDRKDRSNTEEVPEKIHTSNLEQTRIFAYPNPQNKCKGYSCTQISSFEKQLQDLQRKLAQHVEKQKIINEEFLVLKKDKRKKIAAAQKTEETREKRNKKPQVDGLEKTQYEVRNGKQQSFFDTNFKHITQSLKKLGSSKPLKNYVESAQPQKPKPAGQDQVQNKVCVNKLSSSQKRKVNNAKQAVNKELSAKELKHMQNLLDFAKNCGIKFFKIEKHERKTIDKAWARELESLGFQKIQKFSIQDLSSLVKFLETKKRLNQNTKRIAQQQIDNLMVDGQLNTKDTLIQALKVLSTSYHMQISVYNYDRVPQEIFSKGAKGDNYCFSIENGYQLFYLIKNLDY